ncbi:hypothetical protein E2C01_058073 [Portunus trituberculatus]|uniref:Uncharacterized protein n=1 Tax=Portunus trituberculatus TaxID=210409 RepID=A0A5B7H275_PORTR|nr:hypothetical protein [Portunus trituberculatus]
MKSGRTLQRRPPLNCLADPHTDCVRAVAVVVEGGGEQAASCTMLPFLSTSSLPCTCFLMPVFCLQCPRGSHSKPLTEAAERHALSSTEPCPTHAALPTVVVTPKGW